VPKVDSLLGSKIMKQTPLSERTNARNSSSQPRGAAKKTTGKSNKSRQQADQANLWQQAHQGNLLRMPSKMRKRTASGQHAATATTKSDGTLHEISARKPVQMR
jgi:hypothetical protein